MLIHAHVYCYNIIASLPGLHRSGVAWLPGRTVKNKTLCFYIVLSLAAAKMPGKLITINRTFTRYGVCMCIIHTRQLQRCSSVNKKQKNDLTLYQLKCSNNIIFIIFNCKSLKLILWRQTFTVNWVWKNSTFYNYDNSTFETFNDNCL